MKTQEMVGGAAVPRSLPFDAPGLSAALHHRSVLVQAQQLLTAAGLYGGLVPLWEDLGRHTIDLYAARRAVDAEGCETPGAASRLQSFLARSIVEALSFTHQERFVFGSGVTENEKRSPKVLEALVAQVVGGVAHLGGYDAAITDLLEDALPSSFEVPTGKDSKTLIQELFQANKWAVPTYTIVGVTGPTNLQTFEARVEDRRGQGASGKGASKRAAEQEAARQFLLQFFPKVAVDATTRLRFHLNVQRRAASLPALPNFPQANSLAELLRLPSWGTHLIALAFIHPSCERVPSSSMGKDNRLLAFFGSQVVAWGIRDHCIRMIKGEDLDASGGLTAVALSVLSTEGMLGACEWLFEGDLHRINRATTKENSNILTEMLQAFFAVLFLTREGTVSAFTDVLGGVKNMGRYLSSVNERIKPRSQTFASKTTLQERLQGVGVQIRYMSEHTIEGGRTSIRPVLRLQSSYLPDAMNVRGATVTSATHESLSVSQHEEVLAKRVSEIYDGALGLTSAEGKTPAGGTSVVAIQRWLLEHVVHLVQQASAMPGNKQVTRLFGTRPLGLRHLVHKDFASLVLWLRKAAELICLEDRKDVLLRFYVLAGQSAGRDSANLALLKCLDDLSQCLKRTDPLLSGGMAQTDPVFQSVIDHAAALRIASGCPTELKLSDLVDQCALLFRREIAVEAQGAQSTTILEKGGAHLALFGLLFEALYQPDEGNRPIKVVVDGEYLRVAATRTTQSELLVRIADRPLWHALCELLVIHDVKEVDGHFNFTVASVMTDPISSFALQSWWTLHSGGELNAAANGVVATVLHDMKNELLAYFSASTQARQSDARTERYRLAASASRHIERAELQLGVVRTLLESSVTRDSQRVDLASFFRRLTAEILEWMPIGVHFAAPQVKQASYVVSNEEALRSVIVNLTRNAAEAMTDGSGQIGLDYLLDEDDRVLDIEITDDGPGFSAEQLETLNNGMPVESSKRHGSGIGLLTVLLLVQDLGGKVEFHVRKRGGSRVFLRIPSNEVEELESPQPRIDLQSDQEVNV